MILEFDENSWLKTTLKDGIYDGIWCGNSIDLVDYDGLCNLKTTKYVKGINVPVNVHVKDFKFIGYDLKTVSNNNNNDNNLVEKPLLGIKPFGLYKHRIVVATHDLVKIYTERYTEIINAIQRYTDNGCGDQIPKEWYDEIDVINGKIKDLILLLR